MANEWMNAECTHIKLTSEHQLWDPCDLVLETEETTMTNFYGYVAHMAANFTHSDNLYGTLSVIGTESLTGSGAIWSCTHKAIYITLTQQQHIPLVIAKK